MRIKLIYWLKQAVQTALIIAAVSLAVDWWRKPVQPLDFAEQQFQTVGQQAVSLAELSRNRTVVVYFWGSWCGICKYTSPVVQELHAAGVPVLGVALKSGTEQDVRTYMNEQHLYFATLNDPQGDISNRWQVAVTPTIVMVKNGQAVHTTTGLSSYWGLRGRLWLADWFA